MRKCQLILIGLLFSIWPNRPVFAFNPVTDIRDHTVWTFGKAAEIGTAVKFAGGGELKSGETASSFLAGIAEYRFLALSYGGTRVNKSNADLIDTAKIGLRLNAFLDWFKNAPTPEMALLRNINIGPSVAMPLLSSPHVAVWLMDINYQFGSGAPAQ